MRPGRGPDRLTVLAGQGDDGRQVDRLDRVHGAVAGPGQPPLLRADGVARHRATGGAEGLRGP